MEGRLNIAFLWHMHQPMYKDPFDGEYVLPWTLLHGTKDYYDIPALLDEFPTLHQTFNIVPSLIEQLKDYATGNAKDRYRLLSLKKAEDLTRDEKVFVLERFFQANWDHMIRPMPRYWELLKKRGFSGKKEDIADSVRYFTNEDFLDLQTLFNLAWIDPLFREKDPFLCSLVRKEKNYTEEDKNVLLKKQIEIINLIIPKYRELKDRGIIELTTSPYYHPILPLLCDSFSASVAMPDAALPKERFKSPEDAVNQIRMAMELHRDTFGANPSGMWPSEGSVSPEILPLIKAAGLNWIASDEDILSQTLKRPILRDRDGTCREDLLYRPYLAECHGSSGSGALSIIFRDKILSDLIGFEYARWGTEKAVDDMIKRLTRIYRSHENPEKMIVSIILDGENAWEYYENDGRDFLVMLYSRLAESKLFRCVTVSEFLSENPPTETLPTLYSGSWINHNFKIWIGHPEDNAAWDYIGEARKAITASAQSVETHSVADINEAWKELYISQASDWFWWYGDEHASLSDAEFDNLLRAHLKKIYTIIGAKPPEILDIPIITEGRVYTPPTIPIAFINPVIDGEVTNYYEWLSAGRLEYTPPGGAMHGETEKKRFIAQIAYGFNLENLFFRFDYMKELLPYRNEWNIVINFLHPNPVRIEVTVKGEISSGKIYVRSMDRTAWLDKGDVGMLKSNDCVEIGIPFSRLGGKIGDEVRLFMDIASEAGGYERWPARGFLIVEVPDENFELQHWMV